MTRTDLPIDPPSPLTTSQTSEASTTESSLLKSFHKSGLYGSLEHSVTPTNLLKAESGLLPPPESPVKTQFSISLSTADVLLFQYDPFWTRLRTGMLAFFWVFLLILIASAGVTAAFETHVCSFSPPD